jgi:hypothetical protein
MMIEGQPLQISASEIDAAKSEKGGWTRETLAKWGVPWPAPKGWRRALIAGEPIAHPGKKNPDSAEAKLLHRVVMAVINSGNGMILTDVEGLNEYFNWDELPTLREYLRGQGFEAQAVVVEGEARLSDRVYRFTCLRDVKAPHA